MLYDALCPFTPALAQLLMGLTLFVSFTTAGMAAPLTPASAASRQHPLVPVPCLLWDSMM